MSAAPLLIVITGPTGVGKSAAAVKVAKHFNTEIISADSRQIYSELPVTTAAPTAEDMAVVKHHLVSTHHLENYYSAALFEHDALNILDVIFAAHRVAVVCGGSMMYVDALCNGIDDLPTVSPDTRLHVQHLYRTKNWDEILSMLMNLDPEYYDIVDKCNVQRVLHAIEICLESGVTFTSLRRGEKRERPFRIIKIMLTAPREILFERINTRVEQMINDGMVQEVSAVMNKRNLNSMNTVGVKEILRYLDGEWDLDTAIARLQKNTRVYAKKQLTWFARDPEIITIDITQCDVVGEIIRCAEAVL